LDVQPLHTSSELFDFIRFASGQGHGATKGGFFSAVWKDDEQALELQRVDRSLDPADMDSYCYSGKLYTALLEAGAFVCLRRIGEEGEGHAFRTVDEARAAWIELTGQIA
jgi:hypothetical protein